MNLMSVTVIGHKCVSFFMSRFRRSTIFLRFARILFISIYKLSVRAERISLEIPAPFIRIDFIRRAAGLYFCEFTPRPGSVGAFNRKYDHLLGVKFHEAEARLYNDLMSGKEFIVFNKVFSS